MMLAKSLQSAAGNAAGEANYIESVFQTHLYTGNGSTQTITNGIDLAGEGGLVWIKRRNGAYSHALYDTSRGVNLSLSSNTTGANVNQAPDGVSAFDATGFSLNGNSHLDNNTTGTYASWTFRKQPKFFDVVTWSGNSTGGRQISHNLESTPGCIIIKRTDATSDWAVYHRGLTSPAAERWIKLNTTAAETGADSPWSDTAPTSTNFTVNASDPVNASGGTYVAYLFAHNAGGFGLSGEDNVISCGSFSLSGGSATVNLGYEPQWVMVKQSNGAGDWYIHDNMRGMAQKNDASLSPNTSSAESTYVSAIIPTATGFVANGGYFPLSGTYIYIAIRRGPMKVPTDGTKVYNAAPRESGTTSTPTFTSGFVTDMGFYKNKTTVADWILGSRLQGSGLLTPATTNAEVSVPAEATWAFMNGWYTDSANSSVQSWMFRRAPGFFDEVCYTGTGVSGLTITHNLTVAPELMIVKGRSYTDNWFVYAAPLGNTNRLLLDRNFSSGSSSAWTNTSPTASVFYVNDDPALNNSGSTYVAYLFASAPGVSKVTNFTGTGALQTINCGFTSGSRFVLIKRTDSTGDWYVWDSSRGLSSSTDPYLLLNSTAAEVTSTNWVDTTSTGFQVTAEAGNNVNINGASYIALAIS